MLLNLVCFRSLAIALLFAFAPSLCAQNCTGAISTTVNSVSLGSGGVQPIDLIVAPSQIDMGWQVLGSFNTNNPTPPLANAGLNLNLDRYLYRMYGGHGGFVHGAVNGFIGGPMVPFDLSGHAQVQVVIPPGMPSAFIGRTLHHGMYRTNVLTLLPECGTPTVALNLLP